MILFARVVQAGGISSCASSMGLERTTVSRRLADLEKFLRVKLIERSRSSGTPKVTEAGYRLYEHCAQMELLAQDAAGASIKKRTHNPARRVALGTAPEILENILEPLLSGFQRRYPEIELVRTLKPHPGALSGCDIVIAWEHARSGPVRAQFLTSVPQGLYAAPALIARMGKPSTVKDLRNYPCVIDEVIDTNDHYWRFTLRRKVRRITPRQSVRVDSLQQARNAAICGHGIVRLPRFMGDSFVRYGKLTRLLPEKKLAPRQLVTIVNTDPSSKPSAAMLRLFLEDVLTRNPQSR